jgi:acyl carrier protein
MLHVELIKTIRDAAQRLNLLSHDADLIPMDSLDMVNLYVELEEAIGCKIPPETISPEIFQSVSTLAEAVAACLSGRSGLK